MNILRWHVGKLYLLWGWGIAIEGTLYILLKGTPETPVGNSFILVYLLLILMMIVLPLTLTAVTWRWLGGKEKPRGD